MAQMGRNNPFPFGIRSQQLQQRSVQRIKCCSQRSKNENICFSHQYMLTEFAMAETHKQSRYMSPNKWQSILDLCKAMVGSSQHLVMCPSRTQERPETCIFPSRFLARMLIFAYFVVSGEKEHVPQKIKNSQQLTMFKKE